MSAFFNLLAHVPFWTWIALMFLVPMTWLALKLGRYLDQATLTSESRRCDLERNFHLKTKAETALVEFALLCRSLAREADARSGIKTDRF